MRRLCAFVCILFWAVCLVSFARTILLLSGSVCIEKNASRLRRFAPWVAWVETIRAYGLSPAQLDRQADALLIANAMWENGCGFMQNLTDQNISWGSCFAWSSTFNWEFKTVEAFCPITCGCSETHRAYTGCPLPYGFSCDGLWHCLTWNEQHYCPPYVEVIYGEFTMSYNYSHVGVLYLGELEKFVWKHFLSITLEGETENTRSGGPELVPKRGDIWEDPSKETTEPEFSNSPGSWYRSTIINEYQRSLDLLQMIGVSPMPESNSIILSFQE